MPPTTANPGMISDQSCEMAYIAVTNIPIRIPATPPMPDSSNDSDRNWVAM